ncbi:proline-rich protein HaeIII subfamily 1-like [Lontra canadensis]|uniref:proline-rich protein HaeIII subfamily 1-like n=1 Tax=Lontra canadensis TaxID=76717 RepID=UPI0013F338F8|nr:proline-rich protein HaeIII subfamily 1-like [Lontra canadensis]
MPPPTPAGLKGPVGRSQSHPAGLPRGAVGPPHRPLRLIGARAAAAAAAADPGPCSDCGPRALLGPDADADPDLDAEADPRPRPLAWPGTRTQTGTRTESSTRDRCATQDSDLGLGPRLGPRSLPFADPAADSDSDSRPRFGPRTPSCPLRTRCPARVHPAAGSDFRLCSARDADRRPQAPRPRPAADRPRPGPARTPPEVLRREPGGCLVEALAGLPATTGAAAGTTLSLPSPDSGTRGLHETSPGWQMSLVRGQTVGSPQGRARTCPPWGKDPRTPTGGTSRQGP